MKQFTLDRPGLKPGRDASCSLDIPADGGKRTNGGDVLAELTHHETVLSRFRW